MNSKKKTIEDIKNDLQDGLNKKITQRNNLIIELDTVSKELADMLDNTYALDETKVRITCPMCNAAEYYTTEEGKKVICPTCGGRKFIWANKFVG